MQIGKKKGKCVPITIDRETRRRVKSFKDRLREYVLYDEVSDLHKLVIKVILEELDSYDQNILIAYYDLAGESAYRLAGMLGVGSYVITSRIKKIKQYVTDRSIMLADDLGLPH